MRAVISHPALQLAFTSTIEIDPICGPTHGAIFARNNVLLLAAGPTT